MIAWFKKLFGRKPMPIPEYHTITIPPEGVKWPSQEMPYQKTALDTLAQRRALVVEIDRERAKTMDDIYDRPPPATQEMDDFRTRRRPVRVSPHLAAAYGRQPPPVRRIDEPSPTVDLMLVHALLSSPPAPSVVESAPCAAPSYSSGGGGDFGGGGASSSWASGSSSSDSSSSSSDSGSSSGSD